jgi:hypothetical protein
MGLYVHVHVSFSCDNNEGVAELAKKHLLLASNNNYTKEATWFLKDLAIRTGSNPGPKGGMSLWGIIGNYTNVEDFVVTLKPFWVDLLTGVEDGPHSFEHILVFEEREQAERAIAYEIFLEEPDHKEFTVRKHELPFAWMQM